MQYEDTRTIETPEGVELELPLAGLGSRFAAALIDFLIRAAFVLAVWLFASLLLGDTPTNIALVVSIFAANLLYDIWFEVRSAGQTPGKRALRVRVLEADGRAVGLRASAVRNLVRLVEGPALLWVPATISILVTRDNQRLGDLAAGTVVARERPVAGGGPAFVDRYPARTSGTADWDVSAVTAEELAAVRSFLARRYDFEPTARRTLARQLADGLAPRVGGAPAGTSPEDFLEKLARTKASRG
jgi:uncharacterized RDD family membrane protein YckC